MSKNKGFIDFCNSEYAKNLLKSFSSVANYTAMCYINSCDLLTSEIKAELKSGKNDVTNDKKIELCLEAVQQHNDIVSNINCTLQRVGLLCNALLSKSIDLQPMRSTAYLKNFASDCQRILCTKCEIHITPGEDFVFYSFKEFLDIIMLNFIRNACQSSSDSENSLLDSPAFDLSARIKNETPEITINTNMHIRQKKTDTIDTMDFFENFPVEITDIIAEKLGLEAIPCSTHLIIKFPANSAGDCITVEQPIKQLTNKGYSTFRIMLGDL